MGLEEILQELRELRNKNEKIKMKELLEKAENIAQVSLWKAILKENLYVAID